MALMLFLIVPHYNSKVDQYSFIYQYDARMRGVLEALPINEHGVREVELQYDMGHSSVRRAMHSAGALINSGIHTTIT